MAGTPVYKNVRLYSFTVPIVGDGEDMEISAVYRADTSDGVFERRYAIPFTQGGDAVATMVSATATFTSDVEGAGYAAP